MTLLEYLTEVAQRAGKELADPLANKEKLKDHLLRGFNLFHKDFNNRFAWPWRWKTVPIQTTANYETGTVTVTNGSRIVTGDGTVFTAAMEGRIFKLGRDTETYEVLRRNSGTELLLAVPYIGASGSALPYLVWQKYYVLPPDCPYSTLINLSQYPYESKGIGRKELDASFVRAYDNSYPEAWSLAGVDRRVSTYSVTGAISLTENSRTLTGTGTAFLDNVQGGTRIEVGDDDYFAESVDSDTQITLVGMAKTAQSNVDATFTTKNRTRIILSSVPDPQVNLYVTYPKKQYSLVNDNDETELWEGMEHILCDVLYGYYLEKLTSEKSYNWLTIYRQETKEAWQALNEEHPVQAVIRTRGGNVQGYRRSLYG